MRGILLLFATVLLLSALTEALPKKGKFRSRGFDDCREAPRRRHDSSSSSSSSSSEEEEEESEPRGYLFYLVPADAEEPSCNEDTLVEENRAFGKFDEICAKARELEVSLDEVRVCAADKRAVKDFIRDNEEADEEEEEEGEQEVSDDAAASERLREGRKKRFRDRFRGRGKGKRRGGFTEDELADFPLEEDNFDEKCLICPEEDNEDDDDDDNNGDGDDGDTEII